MSADERNPAAVAQPVEDAHGDGRWMSQVCVLEEETLARCLHVS